MTELLKISLPDGSVREMEPGSSPADVAAAIGPGLAKAALAARVNGEVRQSDRSSRMIFNHAAEIAYISTFTTLVPGHETQSVVSCMPHARSGSCQR